MASTKKQRFTMDQTAALITILIVTLWMSLVLWYHLTRPAGAHPLDFVFLGALTPVLWILVLFYLLRLRFSYLGGIFAILVFFAGVLKALSDNTLFFSPSFYNLLTILILLIAALAIWFSFRAFRQRPAEPLWRTIAGLGGTVLLTALLAWLIIANESAVQRLNAQLVLSRLQADLDTMDSLDQKINYLVAEGAIPSLTVALVVDDQLAWTSAYGQDTATNTRYNAASIAKPLIATAILQLSDRGQLDLDADINQYLPFDLRHPQFPDQPITPRLLLKHQSGLAHFTPAYFAYQKSPELLEWEKVQRGTTIYGPVDPLSAKPAYDSFIAAYLDPAGAYDTQGVWTSSRPGTGYNYSSVAYDLLGYLVEQVSGQPLIDYLQQNIFDPLDMNNSGLLAAAGSAQQAPPYERVSSVLMHTNVPLPLYGNERLGGGGLATTAPDLAQFMIAHMNDGRHEDYQLLEPETAALMHQPAVPTTAALGMRASGYGWTIRQQQPWQYWGYEFPMRGAQGHGGSDYGYRASMFYVAEEEGGYGSVMLSNTSDFLKQDMLWYFAIYLQLENLLLDEANALWTAKHAQ
jgi:CubicO group peptidase (beta-lactamase class C family)